LSLLALDYAEKTFKLFRLLNPYLSINDVFSRSVATFSRITSY